MVETVYEEEKVETAVNIIYPNIQGQKKQDMNRSHITQLWRHIRIPRKTKLNRYYGSL